METAASLMRRPHQRNGMRPRGPTGCRAGPARSAGRALGQLGSGCERRRPRAFERRGNVAGHRRQRRFEIVELRQRAIRPWCRDAGRGSPRALALLDDPAEIHHRHRSAVWAITPRSCVMKMMPMPNSATRSFIRSITCAWIVTSSAVVGSSAISSLGFRRKRHGDHRALSHARPKARRRIGRSGGPARICRRGRASRWTASFASAFFDMSVCSKSCSTIWWPMVIAGRKARHRFLEDHRDLVAPDLPKRLRGAGQHVDLLARPRQAA
jgi:hypothetical protein